MFEYGETAFVGETPYVFLGIDRKRDDLAIVRPPESVHTLRVPARNLHESPLAEIVRVAVGRAVTEGRWPSDEILEVGEYPRVESADALEDVSRE